LAELEVAVKAYNQKVKNPGTIRREGPVSVAQSQQQMREATQGLAANLDNVVNNLMQVRMRSIQYCIRNLL
jgi:hypothetical protein